MKMLLVMVDRDGIPCTKEFDLDVNDGWISMNRSDIGKGDKFEPKRICQIEIMQPDGKEWRWPPVSSRGVS